jgi:magnesium transporter
MQKHYTIVNRKLTEVPDGAESLVDVFIAPDEQEKRYLIDQRKLDEHTFASALDPDELSRLEFEPEHVAMIYKRPRNYSGAEQFLFRVASVGAFLFKDRLEIIISEDVPVFDGAQFARVKSPADIILRLIGRSIFHFREHLKGISLISDELQQEINRSMENRHLINMFALQKSLVYYVNSISWNGALLEKLRNNAAKLGFSTEEIEYLDDLIIENSQCYKQADIYSNILASLMDARASIVGNNLNVLMKTLNIITIAIMVPTLVVSTFSMNVAFPLRENQYAFWIILGLAVLSMMIFMTYWLYWRDRRT